MEPHRISFRRFAAVTVLLFATAGSQFTVADSRYYVQGKAGLNVAGTDYSKSVSIGASPASNLISDEDVEDEAGMLKLSAGYRFSLSERFYIERNRSESLF